MLEAILKKEEIIGLPIKMIFKKNYNEGESLPLSVLFSNLINNALNLWKGVEVTGQKKKNRNIYSN